MATTCLVTGANGHLGNNMVRALIANGQQVRAGVRDTTQTTPFKGLDCEVVHLDLLDKRSLQKALEGIDILYQAAAVFQLWARNPGATIVRNNVEGTQNILEVAAAQQVRKIVYVSSIVAADATTVPITEDGWNSDHSNPYFQSKVESEKLALAMAEDLGVNLVSVLPGAMIGPNCIGRLTPTMDLLDAIVQNKIPLDINFAFNHVDVRDVAQAMIIAGKSGRNGERYLLANTESTTTAEMFRLAARIQPGTRVPKARSKRVVTALAYLMEMAGALTGRPPNITRSIVNAHYNVDLRCDIRKAARDLGFAPRSPIEALTDAFQYLITDAAGGQPNHTFPRGNHD